MNCLPFFRWQPWFKVSVVVLLQVFSVSVYAVNVALDTSDAVSPYSFAYSLNGSNTTAPTSGNAYFTGVCTLRTTDAAGKAQTFAGASLSVDSGRSLAFKTDGLIAINNLTLHGGTLAQVGITGATTATLAGTSMSIAADSLINDQTSGTILVIQSAMSGVGGLTIKSSSTSGGGSGVFSQ